MQLWRAESKTFDGFLQNPTLSRSAKMEIISEVMRKAGFSDTFTHFMMIVAENGRTLDSDKILQAFQDIMSTLKGEVVVKVTTTAPLTEWELALLKKNVKLRFFAHNPDTDITVETILDDSLIGGFTIQVGDRFMDLSTRTELRKLQEVIQKTML